MRRTAKVERSRGFLAALAIVVPAMLGGCATPAPSQITKLDWPGFDTRLVEPIPAPARTQDTARRDETPRHRVIVARAEAPRPIAKPYDDPAPQPVPRLSVSYDTAQSSGFAWPVSGKVISPFGERSNGEVNEGINIATRLGEPIRAAASGTVTYAGNELRGYGNLVLIEHADGYVTAYAHAESLKVNRGERVAQGEVIGYAGDTGDVRRPQLHFEIRRGVKPVDPATLLASTTPS